MMLCDGTVSVAVAPLVAQAPGLGEQAASAIGEPKFTLSIWNCTVPVGIPAEESTGATVAVKLIESP